MPVVLIADIETDAIHNPSNLWMLGVLDYHTDEFTAYHGDEGVVDGLLRLTEADILIGHHFNGYDAKQIKRMTNGLIELEKRKIIDTLDLSRRHTNLPDHKLKRWGEMFDFPKGDYTDFSRFDPKMIPYCERDCRLTKMIFDFTNELAMENGRPHYFETIR